MTTVATEQNWNSVIKATIQACKWSLADFYLKSAHPPPQKSPKTTILRKKPVNSFMVNSQCIQSFLPWNIHAMVIIDRYLIQWHLNHQQSWNDFLSMTHCNQSSMVCYHWYIKGSKCGRGVALYLPSVLEVLSCSKILGSKHASFMSFARMVLKSVPVFRSGE